MLAFLFQWLPILFGCHRRPDRSFFYHGKQFPLCARCTGEAIGILFGIPFYILYPLPFGLQFLFILPLLADGFRQLLTAYESTNRKRFITGFFFGLALCHFFLKTTELAFLFGRSLAYRNLSAR